MEYYTSQKYCVPIMETDSHTQGHSQDTQPKNAFAAACIDLHSDEESEADQWEYEYSNTETEVADYS